MARARSLSQLNAEIAAVLSENTAEVEKIFENVDELNHGWLTIETLYQVRIHKIEKRYFLRYFFILLSIV